MPVVAKERSGWRDLGLSDRHRLWGWNCPAVDLDFLFLEYDNGKASAVVEYKHELAPWPVNAAHPTYQAMIDLGNRAGLPVFAVRYKSDYSRYRAVPMNSHAKRWLPETATLLESQWVSLLYKIRGRDFPAVELAHLQATTI
jgi:hypothetical protein